MDFINTCAVMIIISIVTDIAWSRIKFYFFYSVVYYGKLLSFSLWEIFVNIKLSQFKRFP